VVLHPHIAGNEPVHIAAHGQHAISDPVLCGVAVEAQHPVFVAVPSVAVAGQKEKPASVLTGHEFADAVRAHS